MDVVKTHVKELILLGAAADRFEKAAAEAAFQKHLSIGLIAWQMLSNRDRNLQNLVIS